jgi:hypothetical protein
MIADATYCMRDASRIWFFDDEMCFAVHRGSQSVAEDFRDDGGGFAGAVDAVIGLLIRRKTLRVKLAKAVDIAKERAAGHGHAALQQNLDGGIQPHDGNSGGAEEFGSAGLGVGAAAEGEDRAFFQFESAAEGGAELVGFDLAEGRLTEAFENLSDSQSRGFLDAVIKIDEAPGQLASEERADSGLAGAHEPGETKNLDAGVGPAQ